MAEETKRIVLGSGDAYLADFDSTTYNTSDVDALITALFKDENRFGDTKNGATLTYTPSFYTVEDDLGRISETYLTKEEVKLSLGLITITSKMLSKLVETAKTSKTNKGKFVVKIGGLFNSSGADYIIGFRHIDKKHGDIHLIIVGKNNGELSFQFQPESETVLNPSFTASALDEDGTKVIIAISTPEK